MSQKEILVVFLFVINNVCSKPSLDIGIKVHVNIDTDANDGKILEKISLKSKASKNHHQEDVSAEITGGRASEIHDNDGKKSDIKIMLIQFDIFIIKRLRILIRNNIYNL